MYIRSMNRKLYICIVTISCVLYGYFEMSVPSTMNRTIRISHTGFRALCVSKCKGTSGDASLTLSASFAQESTHKKS